MFNLGTSVAKLTHRVNHHDVVASIMKECEVAWGRQSQWGGQEAELGAWEVAWVCRGEFYMEGPSLRSWES